MYVRAAPSEAPHAVAVAAGAPGELLVSWRPPARAAWHGDLLGYSVACTELGPDGLAVPNTTRYGDYAPRTYSLQT